MAGAGVEAGVLSLEQKDGVPSWLCVVDACVSNLSLCVCAAETATATTTTMRSFSHWREMNETHEA